MQSEGTDTGLPKIGEVTDCSLAGCQAKQVVYSMVDAEADGSSKTLQ